MQKKYLFRSAQSAFAVDILEYENPAGDQPGEEDNRLLTCLRLVDRGRAWEIITAILFTWDMERIVRWLGDIVADREVPDGLSFADPSLSIELRYAAPDRGQYCFAIVLKNEALPPWQEPSRVPYVVTVDGDRAGMTKAINELSRQIKAFPPRLCGPNA